MQNEITKADVNEVLNLKPLKGLTVAQALIAATAERIDREANYRYWASRGFAGRGYRVAVARLEAIEYVLRVLEFAQAIEAAQAVAVKPARVRCPWYREIRRAYAIAREAGLDTSEDADQAMRDAFARYLGRAVPSRETLHGGDWARVANAIKGRRLAW